MLQKLAEFFAAFSRQCMPTPFAFAILLTMLVFVLGIALTPSGPIEMVDHWYAGFWDLLRFSMQMIIILLFGYVLAESPPVRAVIQRLAQAPKSAGSAVAMICAISIGLSFVNWGLGLIAGAVSAREICLQAKRRGLKIHYPLAVAAGFAGATTSQGGLSSTTSLLVNTDGHFLMDQIGLIPLAQTIFSPLNLSVSLALIVLLPLTCRTMHPQRGVIREIDEQEVGALVDANDGRAAPRSPAGTGRVGSNKTASLGAAVNTTPRSPIEEDENTLAQRLEKSKLLVWFIVLLGGVYIARFFWANGFDLNLNIVNFLFLVLGLLAYGTPIEYVRAIDRGIKTCGQIALQFPFYAGILGMMAGSGLLALFAGWLASISNAFTFPLVTMLSAGFVNIMVPSNGGQWAVQGPMLMEAAQAIGADLPTAVMAFSYGDQVTNAIQPMWMLPLLGVTALKARDILGYTAVMMLVSLTILSAALLALPSLFA